MDKYDKILEEHRKKRKKQKEQETAKWNKNNPTKKISTDDLAPVRTRVKSDDLAPVTPRNKRSTSERSAKGRTKATTSQRVAERSNKNTKKMQSSNFDFFDKGLFDDGYDVGDISRTIVGTATDIKDNVAQGILAAGESALDVGALIVGGGAKILGNDRLAGRAKGFAARNLVQESEKKLDNYDFSTGLLDDLNRFANKGKVDGVSVLGEDSDAIVQSAAQLGLAGGLASKGVSWVITYGVTGAGSGVQEAFQNDASYKEAAAYGAISAGAEIIFEKLSGGIKFGGKSLDEGAKRLLSRAISNKAVRTAAQYGLDVTGEGMEEVLTELTTNIGKGLTYAKEEDWKELIGSEEAITNYIKAAISGGVIGGAFNAKRAFDSYKTGRDYETGLSADEQKVVGQEVKKRTSERQKEIAINEEVERRIANRDKGINLTAAEKRNIRKTVLEELESGELELDYSKTKVNKKESAEIESQVIEDLKNGRVDMDEIESMFAGEEFEKLKTLMSELKKNPTPERKAEIEAEMDEIKGAAEVKMNDLLKNSPYFTESYRQRLLKGESFARDVQDTDTEITKELTESAKAAGMNNTRKMHDLFEYTNKIANDTDTKYGFINSKQLKEMGYSMEDATINGMVRVQEDGTTKVLINVDSKKALNTIIGHETTHLLEGTKEHGELAAAVKEYATMKGEYDARVKVVSELYRNVDANIENEVTADLVGDYIFTDEQFIQELTKKPNVFHKIYDYIKHAYKMATAGSAEAKQLEKAKRAFEKAYRAAGMNSAKIDVDIYSLIIKHTDGSSEELQDARNLTEEQATEYFTNAKARKYMDDTYIPVRKDTPQVVIDTLKDAGVEIENRSLVMQVRKARQSMKVSSKNERNKRRGSNVRAHDMNPEKMIDIINKLDDPSYIILQTNRENRDGEELPDNVAVIVEYGENEGVAVVEFDSSINPEYIGESGDKNYHTVVTIFEPDLGRDGEPFDYVGKLLDNPNNRELTIKKEQSANGAVGETLPSTKSELFSENIISQNNTKSNPKLSISGESALTANNELLVEARNMELDGSSSETIRQETGWFRGYDGKWRFEVDDSEMDVDVSSAADPKRLADILKHEKLFAAYPSLEDVGIRFTELPEGTAGRYSPLGDEILIDRRKVDDERLKKTLIHEIQHAIQYRESFASGANVSYWQGLIDSGYDSRPKDTRKKEKDLIDEYLEFCEEDIEFVRKMEALLKTTPDMPRGKIDWETLEQIEEDPIEWQEFDRERDNLEEQYGDKVFDFISLYHDMKSVKTQDERTARDLYWKTAGEIEARDVADRLPLNEEGRHQKRPDIDQEDVVFVGENMYSLSGKDDVAPVGGYTVYGKDVKVDNDLALVKATTSKTETLEEDLAPVRTIDNDVAEPDSSIFDPWPEEAAASIEGVDDADAYRNYVESMAPDYRQGKVKKTSEEFPDYEDTEVPMDKESMRLLTKNMKEVLGLNPMQRRVLRDIIQDYSTGKITTGDDLYDAISDQFSVQSYEVINEELTAVKKALRETPIHVPDSVKDGMTNYYKFRQQNFGKLKLGNSGLEIDDAYEALREVYPGHFPEDITNIEDQLYHMAEVASMEHSTREEYVLPEERIAEATDFIRESVSDYKRVKKLDASLKWKNPDGTLTRSAVHAGYMQNIKNAFAEKGMDFDSVMANGKNLSTLATVDNTPQRVMEKTFGYKEGQLLSDLTVNKAAENETEAIRWLNSFTNKKNGTLAKLSKKYNIKPFSKEDAAAQKYAEGMHVNQYGDYVEYGDRELEVDIKDPQMRAKIKAFVADPQLRQIYDETLDAINASRKRNGYREIPKRKDYFLHFREMDDTFSKIGIPFNPNDIKAKDLPTDINGMTADLKPGQPWFGSSMQRKGVGTTYSLLGGMEKYLTAAKPQIFHIDDIQTLRALRNSIADTYGQAKGLENLDELTDEEAEARIEQVYGSHLSTFAKFLNEEANVMAGKTALIDRGLEGVLGRRAVSFMNTLNTNVARNMIGYNISSSLTNLVSAVQAAAKGSKYDVIKAFAQTTSNKLNGIRGKDDGFAEKNSAIVRRKGEDKFYQKPWEKVSDTGFIFMSAIDNVATEFIVRTKYNELTRKGMSEEQAHDEAGKWAMRILGDRSFGQMPQIFNSKTLGLVTKFQLEVRNQLDSMFYDTIQEANVSTEEIENATKRNAVKAAKITSTVAQLAVFQHLFGKAFESISGYNPTFDIIENMMILGGFDDDDEEDEDTFGDNLEQALLGLGEDLPYFSALSGGRIPIGSALPIEQLVQGTDNYGNDKPRLETLGEALPYYAMPTGYNQIKKTVSGLKMFDKDLPISGSYTDSGNLRFPVEATPKNIAQAAVFGQWANENAGEYFDGEHAPLKAKQIEEFKDLDLPIADYWKIREGMSGKKKTSEKLSYIDSLDLPVSKKNILANNVSKRKEPIDMNSYGNFDNLEEMDFAVKNPGKYSMSKAVGGYSSYKTYNKALGDIKADKDSNGKSISGSRKAKVAAYINGLDADYGSKIILYKKEYPSDDAYNADIIEYLNGRDDISYDEMKRILEELDFVVDENGNVRW